MAASRINWPVGQPAPVDLARRRRGGGHLAAAGHHPERLGEHLLGAGVVRRRRRGCGRGGLLGHECVVRMMSPSFATARLAVDLTVPFDSPVASAISASERPP